MGKSSTKTTTTTTACPSLPECCWSKQAMCSSSNATITTKTTSNWGPFPTLLYFSTLILIIITFTHFTLTRKNNPFSLSLSVLCWFCASAFHKVKGKMAMIPYHLCRLPYQDSLKALEADIQHANALWVFLLVFFFSSPLNFLHQFINFPFFLGTRKKVGMKGLLIIVDYFP